MAGGTREQFKVRWRVLQAFSFDMPDSILAAYPPVPMLNAMSSLTDRGRLSA